MYTNLIMDDIDNLKILCDKAITIVELSWFNVNFDYSTSSLSKDSSKDKLFILYKPKSILMLK